MLTKRQIQTISDILDDNNKIKNAWVFGSFARNEETKDSDIDLLFSFKEGKSFGYLEMFGLVDALEQALKRKVDFIKEGALLPFAVESAQRDKILIYGS
jgi:hypothetical protein